MTVSSSSSGSTQDEAARAAESAPSPSSPANPAANDIPLGVAVSSEPGKAGTVTARKAGGLRDMGLEVDPRKVGVKAALQHLAKAVNIAFQTDYGENYLESVYQAAIVRSGEVHIVHREYFGFGDTWFGQFGRLIRSLQLTLEGPDPASPEGQQRIAEKGPRHDPGHPQPDRPQARPGRRVRGPRAGLRRADVRPARSLGHHRRLGPRRLGHLDHEHRPRHPDRARKPRKKRPKVSSRVAEADPFRREPNGARAGRTSRRSLTALAERLDPLGGGLGRGVPGIPSRSAGSTSRAAAVLPLFSRFLRHAQPGRGAGGS